MRPGGSFPEARSSLVLKPALEAGLPGLKPWLHTHELCSVLRVPTCERELQRPAQQSS